MVVEVVVVVVVDGGLDGVVVLAVVGASAAATLVVGAAVDVVVRFSSAAGLHPARTRTKQTAILRFIAPSYCPNRQDHGFFSAAGGRRILRAEECPGSPVISI
jgi:hypothetical protein